ncbi:MAG: hypothetical protein DRR19_25265 [Candidatus Parabeggiatoa sp. nov. 1]|nr:MAG: hypothetical protein DRR19_25265 [Gammaproteobacteria bacterium]
MMNNISRQKPSFSTLFNGYMADSGIGNAILARRIDVSRHTIRRWRRGEIKSPSCDKIRETVAVLKLPPPQQAELLRAAGCEDKPTANLIPVISKPIMSPNQFFGREEVLSRIQRAWYNKSSIENVAIIGPRGSGKTSLLHYLKEVTTAYAKKDLRADQPKGWSYGWCLEGFQFAMIDFQDSRMYQPDILARCILEQLQLEVPNPCSLECLTAHLKQLEKPTVIMIDEIEKGLKAPTLDAAFWYNLRSASATCHHFALLASARESFEQLVQDEGKSSPLFNLFGHVAKLDPFTLDEAYEFLHYFPKALSQADKDWIVETSHRWPVLLQILCDQRLLAFKNEQPEAIWKTEALNRISIKQSQPLLKSVYSTFADFQEQSSQGELDNQDIKKEQLLK